MNKRLKNNRLRKLCWFLFVKVPLALVLLSVLVTLLYRWTPVFVTPLMISRRIEYRGDKEFRTQKKWRSLDRISVECPRAVIASEDNLFFTHKGFDWDEIDKVLTDHREKGTKLRGASTISQQTAKNVFLLPSRTLARKVLEAYFTFLIERLWGKRRILEVYLNVAEMGKGIYGIEAASQAYFQIPAARMNRSQACLVAASLPNPLQRNPASPSAFVRRRARDVAALERKLSYPDWLQVK